MIRFIFFVFPSKFFCIKHPLTNKKKVLPLSFNLPNHRFKSQTQITEKNVSCTSFTWRNCTAISEQVCWKVMAASRPRSQRVTKINAPVSSNDVLFLKPQTQIVFHLSCFRFSYHYSYQRHLNYHLIFSFFLQKIYFCVGFIQIWSELNSNSFGF